MAFGLPGGWLRDTAALYARVFGRGAELALRNWWVGLVVIVYAVLLGMVAVVTAPLGLVGGLLRYLGLVACFSSWLALVAQVIQTGRIRLGDVPTSFATYFGDLLNVGFVLWGLQLIWTYVLAPVPFVQIVFGLAVFVFLNAVPDLVYAGRPVLRLEEPLGVDRGHAARAGRRHRLAVARVLDVAAGEDAEHARLRRPWPGPDVAALVHLELAREEPRVGLVADGDEDALGL